MPKAVSQRVGFRCEFGFPGLGDRIATLLRIVLFEGAGFFVLSVRLDFDILPAILHRACSTYRRLDPFSTHPFPGISGVSSLQTVAPKHLLPEWRNSFAKLSRSCVRVFLIRQPFIREPFCVTTSSTRPCYGILEKYKNRLLKGSFGPHSGTAFRWVRVRPFSPFCQPSRFRRSALLLAAGRSGPVYRQDGPKAQTRLVRDDVFPDLFPASSPYIAFDKLHSLFVTSAPLPGWITKCLFRPRVVSSYGNFPSQAIPSGRKKQFFSSAET